MTIISNVKIAVVDDDEPHRGFVVNALMYCVNRDVISFENSYSAWLYLEGAESADIVVSDAEMPEMDGFELISRIKNKFPGKICILMSGNPANEKMAIDIGADAFLAKPFSVNDLFTIVQTFVVGEH
ncbi:MAG: response regulator [Proteobacteria bacterium]|nr:response regulator [Pseudomonadota bacterium]